MDLGAIGSECREFMKVAYVLMSFPTASETFARRDMEAMRALGHVVVPCSLRRTSGESRLAYWSACIRGLVARQVFLVLANLLRRILISPGWRPIERLKCIALLPAAARVAAELGRLQPDVVHLFWGHYPALVTLLAKRLLPNTRFSLFLGAYDLELKLPVSRWAAEASDICFTHAHVNVEPMQALLGSRAIHVVHRGIELGAYPAVEALDFSARRLRVFTAGRLIPDKGFDRVIAHFARVAATFPGAELVVAGAGPELPRLRSLACELGLDGRISFPGWLSEADVREQLLASRAVLLLSSKPGERLPNVVKEAMAAGCVTITSRSPGIEELVESGVDGFVCDMDDGPRIEECLTYALSDSRAPLMSRKGAEKIRCAFDVQRAVRSYADKWSAIVERT